MSIYVGKSYDTDHFWIIPTIGFNRKSIQILWLDREIYIYYGK